jgi:hypothetical protein
LSIRSGKEESREGPVLFPIGDVLGSEVAVFLEDFGGYAFGGFSSFLKRRIFQSAPS